MRPAAVRPPVPCTIRETMAPASCSPFRENWSISMMKGVPSGASKASGGRVDGEAGMRWVALGAVLAVIEVFGGVLAGPAAAEPPSNDKRTYRFSG